jgi:hypothetical protein
MITLVSLVLSAMVLFVVFALPVNAYRQVRFPANPGIESVRQLEELPIEAEAFFRRTATSLVTHGFRDRLDVWRAEYVPGCPFLICVLENPLASDWLMILVPAEPAPAKVAQVPSDTLEFRTWYADGHRVVSRNRIGNPFGGRWPESHVLELPEATSAVELYCAHMAMLDRFAGHARKEDRGEINALTWLQTEWDREIETGLARGFLRAVVPGSVYAYTWKGAFLTVWLSMWPLAELRQAIHRWQSARLMTELRVA